MKITSCKVNHLKNPIGYSMKKCVFSWIAEEEKAAASRIRVYENGVPAADTDWADLDFLGTYVPLTLKPRTVYSWTVSAKNEKGELFQSMENTFETGKRGEPWIGKWITCEKTETRHPYFQKNFRIDGKPVSARLYICGLGLYEACINGKKVTEEWLLPEINAYDCWLQAQTFDVTDLLAEDNHLSVLLGNGWYKGRCYFESEQQNIYGDSFRLIAELHITFADGTSQVVATDEDWLVKRSKILSSGIYDGEIIDDTLPELPVEKAFLLREEMPPLEDRLSIPIMAREHFKARLVNVPDTTDMTQNNTMDSGNNEFVLDIGQNLAGAFSLRVKEPYGTRIHLQFGELLQDGRFYRDNLRTAKAEFVYISDGKEHLLCPKFTFYGFRYVKITGIKNLNPEAFDAFALYSNMEMRGTLETGHAGVNRLIQNTIWGMKSNFVGNPTDCPQRDERMGWTGDAQVFSETAGFLADTYLFFQRYLVDMQYEQGKLDGCVPDIVPAFLWKKGCTVWGDAICIIPWNLYLYYGDKTILEDCYEGMKSWLSYIAKVDGDDHGYRRIFHYGDWLALDSHDRSAAATRGGTDEGFIADVYYRKSALITAKTAHILGDEESAEYYRRLADRILDEINHEFYSPAGRCCIPTQTAQILTLTEGLNNAARAKETLQNLLLNNGNKLATGFVGTPLLCGCLTKCGLEKEAFGLLLNEEYPGWLYEVNLGATTVWERWNSLDETGHISSTGMNSLNHYAYGSIVGWIWRDVAGIHVVEDAPGLKKLRIEPHVNWKLRHLQAEYDSSCGKIKIFWEMPDISHVHIKVCVPVNCEAKIKLPFYEGEEITLEGGEFETTYQTACPAARRYSARDTLKELLSNADTKNVLEEHLNEDLNHMITVGMDYPLRETLHNLEYEDDFIDRIDGLLREAY